MHNILVNAQYKLICCIYLSICAVLIKVHVLNCILQRRLIVTMATRLVSNAHKSSSIHQCTSDSTFVMLIT